MVSEKRSIPCRVLVCFLDLLVFFWESYEDTVYVLEPVNKCQIVQEVAINNQ